MLKLGAFGERVQVVPKDFRPRNLPAARDCGASASFPARPESALVRWERLQVKDSGSRQAEKPEMVEVVPDTPLGVGGPSPWYASPAGEDGFLF